MNEPKLIARIDGGLVNKMLAYMSAKVIAKFLNKSLHVHWTPHLGGLCENIFILFNDSHTTSITATEYDNYQSDAKFIYSRHEFEEIESFDILDGMKDIVLREYYLEIRPKFIPADLYRQEMVNIWKSLDIKPNILNMVPKIDKNSITLHLRRHHGNINISMNSYENIILKELSEDQSTKFFITTDNLEDKTYLLKKYPGTCFSNEITTYWDTKNESGVVDAFVDILTINQTRKIYTPQGSTFTYLANYDNENIISVHIPNDS